MNSPAMKEASKLCFQGCCQNPITKLSEPDQKNHVRTRSSSSACRHNFINTTATSFFPNTHFTNHESIPSLQESFVQFIKAYPKYSDTAPIDRIRAREYPQLLLSNHVCLDYIGVGLFSQSQAELPLFEVTFKSVSLKSQLLHGGEGSELESAIKKRIMEFLNISQSDYTMVFTANRSAAFKLVAESYPFQTSHKLLTVYDYESEAIETMVNASEKRGAHVMAAEFKWPRLRVHSAKLRTMIARKKRKKKSRGLFVFPLQSRMSGGSYSYQWMTSAQEQGWHVLLDACALGPKDMGSFGLSLFRPDFLICSFYKVFGENPTGFGCLFVKKQAVTILEDTTGAGIVSITPSKNFSSTETELEQDKKPEDDHQQVDIQCRCLDHVDSLGLMLISSRGRYLINWLVTALMKLQHPNRLENFPLVIIYGPQVKFDRGPALAFNIYDWKEEKVEPVLVQKLADRNNISLSHGYLQHIWFPEKCEEEKLRVLERENKEKYTRVKGKKAEQRIKVVTIALTFLANFEDVYRVWAFIAQFLDADFVEKERWRYTALDQKTIEV